MISFEEAMQLPFEEYISWCHSKIRDQSKSNCLIADIYNDSQSKIFLESLWARRYWFANLSDVV